MAYAYASSSRHSHQLPKAVNVSITSRHSSVLASKQLNKSPSDNSYICTTSMDRNHHGQMYSDRRPPRSESGRSRASNTNASSRSRQQGSSNSRPQHQQSEFSLAIRPARVSQPENSRTSSSGLATVRHRQSSANEGALSPPADYLRPLRRPRSIRNLFGRTAIEAQAVPEQQIDISLLTPEFGIYGDRRSSHSAPDDFEYFPRSVSQPNTPYYPPPSRSTGTTPPTSIPRSPTYPPSNRRRTNRANRGGDAEFEDEEEFRLFVEATTGLGHEQALEMFRHSPSSSSPQRSQRRDRRQSQRQSAPSELISPVEQTPTTLYALQHLAQMPEAAGHHIEIRQRPQISTPRLDQWEQPPSVAVHRSGVSPMGDLGLGEDFDDYDDELPDYAESQAQAQAHMRVEATRRAQELQRRWQQSGSRRGV